MKNLFVDVAFSTISQTVNIEKIKEDIEIARKKITQGKKILIILDDMWEKLNLEELCIPCGTSHMNCKIMFTTRNEDVCKKMNAQSKICVEPLTKDETWILFKQVVGDSIENDDTLKQVAMKVAQECGGLPLLVQAVGSALKDRSIKSWNSALNQLKEHAPLDIDPDIKKAYTHLKLSYDYLESEEAKSCFLLCSMFPEDQIISLEDLVYYGVGLAKFNKLKSMNDARDKVRNAVHTLTSSGLLLVINETHTKMHDVVRDVALLIASEGKNMVLVEAGKGLSEWLPRNNTLGSYTGISLMINKINMVPDYEVHFPRLTSFLISYNELSMISNEFIGGMKEARVLDMAFNKISSLPQSFKLLTKLCMLDLRGNTYIDDISILGELKDLEILILCETGIKEIPQEIGQLVNLRRLDVSDCQHLCHISPGVLLKLCWLEELCIGFSRMQDKGIYDSLVEVMNMSKLKYLNLLVPSSDVIPEGFNRGNLNGFVIQIGGYTTTNMGSVSQTRLVLSQVNPNISLHSIENLNYILRDLYHKGFYKFDIIMLLTCQRVRCLVDWNGVQNIDSSKEHLTDEWKTEENVFKNLKYLYLIMLESLEVVWQCPDEYICLSNLVTLCIDQCDKLVQLFSVSVAQGLVNLQRLSIVYGDSLEEVITSGDDEDIAGANIIVFPSLADIVLVNLNSLKSFCSGNYTIKYPSLLKVNIERCGNMKKWANGIQDTPKLKCVNDVPLDGPNGINDAMVKALVLDENRMKMTTR